jgi:drug/metabolite transporter (DMT)-like permease
MWFTYAILAGLTYTFSRTIERHLLKGNKNFWAYSFWFSAIGALIAFPFMIIDAQLPELNYYWLLMLAVGIMITLHNFLNFKAVTFIGPSLHGAITKSRIIWIFIFGLIFLQENFTYNKLIGVILTVLAGILLISKFKTKEHISGFIYSLSPTIIYAAVITLYSVLFREFNTASLTFFIFLIPAILNLTLMPGSTSKVISFLKINPIFIISAAAFAGFGNLAMNQALKIGDQTQVIIIIETFAILLIGLEYFVLKEKEKPLVKIIALGMAVAGAIIVKI